MTTRKANDLPQAAGLDLAQFEGHTPGPWILVDTPDSSYASFKIRTVEAGYIASILHSPGNRTDEANAALMHAAPALLAKCKRQREEIRDIALMLLTTEQRGKTMKWASGIVGSFDKGVVNVRLEELAEVCTERDRQREEIELGKAMYGRAMAVFAEERDTLRAKNERLRRALEHTVDQLDMLRRGDDWAPASTAGALKQARAALKESK